MVAFSYLARLRHMDVLYDVARFTKLVVLPLLARLRWMVILSQVTKP